MPSTQNFIKRNTGFISQYINYYNCLILCFFILSFIGILNHEMWRDETQAWLIARDSSTLIDLYQNLKYEGHPGLWHFCLFLIAKCTHNPFGMQFFHIVISTAIVYIFVKLSPFNILQKTLFTFGYFPFFEYNLISRNYNLGLLLVFIFCYLFTRRNINYIASFLTLAFLANTNVYGLIISLCLSTTLIIDTIIKYRISKYKLNHKQKKNLYIGLLILFLGLGLSFFQLFPVAIQHTTNDIQKNIEKQIVLSELELILIKLKSLAFTLKTIWNSYIPIPNFFEYHFWNKSISSVSIILGLFALFISFLILLFSVFIFIDKPIVLFLYLSGTLGIFLLTLFKWRGNFRHHGHLFIIFLACIWISKFFKKSYNIPNKFQKIACYFKKSQTIIITFILLIQMLAGLYAYSMDLIYPFSKSKAAAQFIQNKNLDEAFILGSRDGIVSPISAYIDKKIFYIENNRLGSFFQNPRSKSIKDQSELIDKINLIIKNTFEKKVLILSYPLNIRQSRLKITKIGDFDGSIIANERYYIYMIEKID